MNEWMNINLGFFGILAVCSVSFFLPFVVSPPGKKFYIGTSLKFLRNVPQLAIQKRH